MRLKSSTMRLLLTALTCLISGSVICQKIDTLNTNIPSNDDSYLYHDNYDLEQHSKATAGKYIGITTMVIGSAVAYQKSKNGEPEHEIDGAIVISGTGALLAFICEFLMDLQTLELGKKSRRLDSKRKSRQVEEERNLSNNMSNPDGIYLYRNNDDAKFIVKEISQTNNNILIYFESKREMGEQWIDPLSDKLIWLNDQKRDKFYKE